MKSTPTLLMKELKYLDAEVDRIQSEDLEKSTAPINDDLSFKYDNNYSYSSNREQIKELFERQLKIKSILAKFNSETKLESFNFTVAEGLVRIAQLKKEIRILNQLSTKTEYSESGGGSYSNRIVVLKKINYDQTKVREDLKLMQKELSSLQIEIDRVNLTTFIEI